MSAPESPSEREELLDEDGEHDEALPLLEESERHKDERQFGRGYTRGCFNKQVFGDYTSHSLELLRRKHYIVIGVLFSLGLTGFIVMTAFKYPKFKSMFV